MRAMKGLFLIGITMLFFSQTAFAGGFREVKEGDELKFPRDFYYRPGYRLQWWYFTGHLYDQAGREFGYELTFFAVGVQQRRYISRFGVDDIYISHFAVTDISDGRYYTSEKADSGAYSFAGADNKILKVWVGDDELGGTPDKMHLRGRADKMSLDLELVPEKPVVLNGDKGYSRKSEESPEAASLYFSYTDLKTAGTVRIGGKTFSVGGRSWFDREISSGRMGKGEKGWDWFSMQLEDGRQIMLYIMRKAGGAADRYSSGTFIYKDGKYRHLGLSDFNIKVLSRYKSDKTGAEYPAGWDIRIPSEGLDLKITPLVGDQEFVATHSTGNYYWEGDCKVEGTAYGRAYVEMTGY